MADTITVLQDGVTLNKHIGDLIDPVSKTVIGTQSGPGHVYLKDSVVDVSNVSTVYLEALDNEDHPAHASIIKKIARTGSEPETIAEAMRTAPFAGYDEMDDDDVVAAMNNLPSAAIQQVKRYEAAHDNRDKIVNYNIGYGEDPEARQESRVNSGREETAEGKPTADIQTRELPDDNEDGTVTPGEGITGTGDPPVAPGTAAKEGKKASSGSGQRGRQRRSRQSRSQGSGGENEPTQSGSENE